MLNALKTKLRALLRRSEIERELDEELRYHIEQQTEQNIRLGMSPEEARCAARKAFGGVEQSKEQSRDARGVRWLEELWQDLRYGARMLCKKPGFTLIAVLTLALGNGANTAIFSVVNAALLRGLPYREPEQLVHLWERTPQQNPPQREASYPDLLDWRQNQVFSGMAAYSGGGNFSLLGNDGPEPTPGGRATTDFFDVLGVEPILGRTFREGEDQPGAERVVLLTYSFWQQRYGGKPDVIGQTLGLNDNPYTVIGVLPPSFQFAPLGAAELWTPWQISEPQRSRRVQHSVNVIARLKHGVSHAQAQAEMQIIARRIEQEHRDSHAGTSIVLLPLHEQIVGSIKPLLFVLFCAVGFVLLIACANVANLLLVRAAGRQKEIAIRAALDAGGCCGRCWLKVCCWPCWGVVWVWRWRSVASLH